MPGALTPIGSASGTVVAGGTITLTTTAAVAAGGKILIDSEIAGLTANLSSISDDAGNIYDSLGAWWVCEPTLDTPAGTVITFTNGGADSGIAVIEAFELTGVTGTRTEFSAQSELNPTVPDAFSYGFDSPASGQYFYAVRNAVFVQATTGLASVTDDDAIWGLEGSAQATATFGFTAWRAFRSLWSLSHTGDGSTVTFNGTQDGPGTTRLFNHEGVRWAEATITGGKLAVAHSPLRHRIRAFLESTGALKVERFDDASPPAVAATVTVESADCTDLDLKWRRDGVGELLYAKSGTVYRKCSRDQGRTWSVADTVATGYEGGCQAIDEKRGLIVVGLFDESAEKWYVTVGSLNAGGTAWADFTTPTEIASSARAGAHMIRRPDGVFEFDYTTTGDVRTIKRCRSLSGTSNGSWS